MTRDEYRNIILPVLRPYGFRSIAMFGSVARGEETESSDIDLLVEVDPDTRSGRLGMLEWVALEEELSRCTGKKVDLVSRQGLSPYLRPFAEREAIVLHEN